MNPYDLAFVVVAIILIILIIGAAHRAHLKFTKEQLRESLYNNMEIAGNEHQDKDMVVLVITDFVIPVIVEELLNDSSTPTVFVRRRSLFVRGFMTLNPASPFVIRAHRKAEMFAAKNDIEYDLVKDVTVQHLISLNESYATVELKRKGVI